MTNSIRRWLSATLIFSYSLSLALADDVVDEITVTADLRGRSLVDVPFSVSAMDEEFLEQTAVQHFEELVNIVPNMNWSGDGHRARYFQIRGVGELEQYQGAPNPSVGFLIDDIDFSGIGTVATLFDVQSVEVLRGPQGSRYGANALGGLVYLKSTAASADRDGRLRLTFGGDDMRSLGLAFGGAVDGAEAVNYRVSAQHHVSDGFRDNDYLARDDTNGRDETTIRGKIRIDTSTSLTADVAIVYANIDNGYDAFALDNSYTVLSDQPGQDAQESLGASIRFDWRAFGELTATSISTFANSDIVFSFDADWGNEESWGAVTYDYVSQSDRARNTVSQEFRLGSDQWLLGVYALRLDERLSTLNLGDYYDPLNDFGDSLNDRFGSDFDASSLAAFAQYDHRVTGATEFSAGLRAERRTSNYTDTSGIAVRPSEGMWGGEFSLRHAFGDHANAYVTVSRGYRAGGFNLGPTPPGKRDFDTETMVTVELGVKSILRGGRLRLNAAAFRYRRSDQQVRTATQLVSGDPASFVFFTDNVGAGEAVGVEADVHWYPLDNWEVYGTIGLIDATLESGRDVAHAPPYTVAAGVAYRTSNGFFARVDATSKDAFFFDVGHDQTSQPFALFHSRIGYDGEHWRASLWIRNLFDEEYAVRGFYFGNEPPDFPDKLYTRLGDPRQIGVTIERGF